jgi:Zn-dependent peptidase ImmA (M78 family)
MNREKTIRFLRQICLQYEVKVVFRTRFNKELDGEVDVEKEIIYIDKKLPRKGLAEAVFHELGHIYCVRKGLWTKFHKDHDYSAIKSFKAENWVEH